MAGPFFLLRRRAVLAASLLGAALGLAGSAGPAAAQGWGFFGGLFGGGQQQQQLQAPRPQNRYYARPRRKAAVPRPRAEPKEAEAPPKAPSPDASHFVAVFGDSLGQILATGLDDALSDRSDVAVLHDARDSSGLVREDYYSWPKAIAEALAPADSKGNPKGKTADTGKPAPRIDVAVMMIGSNDRQSLSDGGKTFAPGTEQWTALYAKRVTAVAELFRKANVPLVWVGIPITKDDTFADDMAALNDIYRDVAAKTGATFVDTWEAFSDDNGDFSAFGPDVNGQTVRLRSSDGIHFTKAGGRKLAHFVDTHIRRALDQRAPLDATPATARAPSEAPLMDRPEAAVAPIAKPEAGPVELLTQVPVATNGQLAVPAALKAVRRDPLIDTALIKGEAQTAHPGRADDASWPPR